MNVSLRIETSELCQDHELYTCYLHVVYFSTETRKSYKKRGRCDLKTYLCPEVTGVFGDV